MSLKSEIREDAFRYSMFAEQEINQLREQLQDEYSKRQKATSAAYKLIELLYAVKYDRITIDDAIHEASLFSSSQIMGFAKKSVLPDLDEEIANYLANQNEILESESDYEEDDTDTIQIISTDKNNLDEQK